MNTNIFEAQESVIAFHKSMDTCHGTWYAGDGAQWIKCDNCECAQATKLRYIFFVNGRKATLYQA